VSQDHVEIVRRGLDHLSATMDLPEEAFAPDWVLDLTHATRIPDHLPRYEGTAGWREFFDIWRESFEELQFEWSAFHDAGDRVVVTGRQRGIARASRVPAEQALGLVYTLRDGLITRLEIFNGSGDEALKAVGLKE
jgi:ketosteroid isomerase-like protein